MAPHNRRYASAKVRRQSQREAAAGTPPHYPHPARYQGRAKGAFRNAEQRAQYRIEEDMRNRAGQKAPWTRAHTPHPGQK